MTEHPAGARPDDRLRPQVAGILLAAGAGTRFGSPKITAHQGDWVKRAVRSLADGGCGTVLVTMGAAVVEPPAPGEALIVGEWREGLSRSVEAGLRAARRAADPSIVVLHVVDTPDVGPDVVRRVIAASGARRSVLARATFGGRAGHPVVIGADHIDAVLAGLSGDVGAGPYLTAHADVVIEVECGDLATGADHDVDGV